MYTRYIPQPDGSYRRSRIQDSPQKPVQPPKPPEQETCSPPPPPPQEKEEHREATPCPRRQPRTGRPVGKPQRPQESCPVKKDNSAGSFLKNLLPRDFDTGDLLIVLLLLLMAGDCREDQNTALLTLALYLFM